MREKGEREREQHHFGIRETQAQSKTYILQNQKQTKKNTH